MDVEHLKKLEVTRLIKEFDFVSSDLQFKSEYLTHLDQEFINDVNLFLESHPDLKSVFDEKTSQRNFPDPIKTDEVPVRESDPVPIEGDYVSNTKDPKLKNLYRSVVKSTHPDKRNDLYLNSLYLEAQQAYDTDNLIKMLSICDKLNIPFDISEDEADRIKGEIGDIKNRSAFLENTFTWNWHQQKDSEVRKMIILSYIKKQII